MCDAETVRREGVGEDAAGVSRSLRLVAGAEVEGSMFQDLGVFFSKTGVGGRLDCWRFRSFCDFLNAAALVAAATKRASIVDGEMVADV